MLRRLKAILLRKLLEDVDLEEIKVRCIKIGGRTMVITPNYVDFAALTADPALAAGRMWFRSDLETMRYSPNGMTTKDFPAPPLAAPVFELYADISLAAGATYTPIDPGMFSLASTLNNLTETALRTEIYNDIDAVWDYALSSLGAKENASWHAALMSDGANFRVNNTATTAIPLLVMRMNFFPTVGYVSASVAGLASFTPAFAGYFGLYHHVFTPLKYSAAQGADLYAEGRLYAGVTMYLRYGLIGDGANLKFYNPAETSDVFEAIYGA